MKVKDIIQNNSIWIPSRYYGKDHPTVSVLLPTFRRGKSGLFRKAVESVIHQTMKDIELIIIDDGSVDGTYDQIMEFMSSDPRISCIRHQHNVGLPAISEYEGYLKSRGNYIAFIFDDVEWQPDALGKMISLMNLRGLKCAFGRILARNDPKNLQNGIMLGGQEVNYILADLESHNFIANAGVVMHRDVIEEVGLYDPHVVLTRLCDWDLWRRVLHKFEFEGLDVFMGYENGFITEESIGHTIKMDLWGVFERLNLDRDKRLRPCHFAEANVFEIHENATETFKALVKELAQQYADKNWFLKGIKDDRFYRKKLTILVVCPGAVDASVSLYFGGSGYDGAIFRIITSGAWFMDELAGASCVIFIRLLHTWEKWIEASKLMKIPIYYFIDDNFIELSSTYPELRHYTVENVRNWLIDYDGVFVSTEELKEYFLENKLHEKVFVFPPVLGKRIREKDFRVSNDGMVNIAFMGGKFRAQSFIDNVWPAILEISKEKRINLYCPDDPELRVINDKSKNIRLTAIPRSLSLDQTLIKYGKWDIDILVHPGPEIANNRFKTLNLLLVAVQLGAVLIVPNKDPFNRIEGRENLFVSVDQDSPTGWRDSIAMALNSSLRERLVKNARAYCHRFYGGDQNREVLNRLLATANEVGLISRVERIKAIGEKSGGEIDYSRISLSPRLRWILKYRIRPQTPSCKSLSVLIKIHAETKKGFIKMRLYSLENNKYPLRISEVPIEKVKDNHWTVFAFDPIVNCLGKEMIAVFTLQDQEPGTRLSFYEVAALNSLRNSRILKVVDKLKIVRSNLYYRMQ